MDNNIDEFIEKLKNELFRRIVMYKEKLDDPFFRGKAVAMVDVEYLIDRIRGDIN